MHKIKKKQNYPVIVPWKIWAAYSLVFNTLFKWELATENHKLDYANVDLVFPLEVQQYGTT